MFEFVIKKELNKRKICGFVVGCCLHSKDLQILNYNEVFGE